MERVKGMAFLQARFAPPMWAITIQTTKLSILLATIDTGEFLWRQFVVQKVFYICLFIV
jgi:hypothetical protein